MCDADVERILLTSEEIEVRVEELAREIRGAVGPGEIFAVGVLTGAFVFLADLLRRLGGPTRVGFVDASSYGDGTVSGDLLIRGVDRLCLGGQRVLVVEDIVDTGRSLSGLLSRIREEEPLELRTVALLDKAARREVSVQADFFGFEVPDEFLVGYGLDYAGRYRDLPYVGILARRVYESGA